MSPAPPLDTKPDRCANCPEHPNVVAAVNRLEEFAEKASQFIGFDDNPLDSTAQTVIGFMRRSNRVVRDLRIGLAAIVATIAICAYLISRNDAETVKRVAQQIIALIEHMK